MPLDASRGRSPTGQQFPLEKQETISTSSSHQWRGAMSPQHTCAKPPCAAAGSNEVAAAWDGEGVQGLAAVLASGVELLGCLDKWGLTLSYEGRTRLMCVSGRWK